MSQGYYDEFVSGDADTVDAASQDFDWKLLYRRLNEEACEAGVDEKLAEAVSRILQLLIGKGQGRVYPNHIGLKVVALAWVLNPAYFKNSPSLRQLAGRCGVTPATLAHLTGYFSRFMGWRNRAQRHAWNWQGQGSGDGGSTPEGSQG
jgi:hypothetical protein